MRDHRASGIAKIRSVPLASAVLALSLVPGLVLATEDATVSGNLVANGETVELPFVYVWAEDEGFFDPADPTWTVLFVEHPLEARDLGRAVWDSAWIEIGITETDAFSDRKEVQVYAQSIKLSADAPGNLSGGEYPAIELKGLGSDRVSGRIWHAEEQQIFDDSFRYDITFSAPLSDPNAPIGELLPADGGEPGKAYLAWVEAVHAGEIEGLKSIVPAEMAAQLDAVSPEEAREEIAFMQAFTPTDVTILGGSSDGDIALLQIEGTMEGETVPAEITMEKIDGFWIPTGTSM